MNGWSRTIAQAVSRRFLTSAACVRTQARSCGICSGQIGAGARLLLPILIPSIAPHSSSSIIRGWYNRPNSGRRNNELSLTPRN
jgi:hypothetical protein